VPQAEIDILPRSHEPTVDHMPKIKMKSNSSAKKRFKLTANGRVKRKKAYLRHNLTSKSASAKRKLRRGGYISKTQEHQIKAMLPYA
jgi:large subunit ribosomal protein L35